MGQLHEILSIEQDLKQKKKELIDQLNGLLTTTSVFEGYRKKTEFFDDDRKNEEKIEMGKVQVRVDDTIMILKNGLTRWIDLKYQKEDSNQKAKADIIIENKTLLKEVPVTFLLGMEEELKELIKIIKKIPVLSKEIDWKKLDDNTYQSEKPVIKPVTALVYLHKVLYKHTPEHPAQIKEWTEQRPCGQKYEDKWSGMIPEKIKLDYLKRCENLLYAIKKARQRANTLEVTPSEVGRKLLDYIFNNGS